MAESPSAEQKWSALSTAMGGTGFVVDDAGRYVDVYCDPDKEYQLFDEPDDLAGKQFEDVFEDTKAKEFRSVVREVLASRDRTTYEYTLSLDGEPRRYNGYIAPIRSSSCDGSYVLWLAIDVTAENHAVNRDGEYSVLLETVRDVITVVDGDGRIRYDSPAVEEVHGFDPAERLGKSVRNYIHPTDRDRIMERLEDRLAGKSEFRPTEFRAKNKDGSWTWVESRGRILDNEPSQEELVTVSRDISERKANEQERNRQIDRLEEVVAMISHDLRNPLMVARGKLALARESAEQTELSTAEAALDRMDTMIDDLLVYARNGQESGQTKPVQLDSLVAECWRTVETEGATLQCQIDRSIRSDPSKVKQLLENLFGNAVEHGGPEVAITVGEVADGFYVSDDGPGIPPGERTAIFEPGYSTNSDGTGLGLSIVERVAEAHGWAVRITESESGGARFEISVSETQP
jgi:PAS domain S-box-containing protein